MWNLCLGTIASPLLILPLGAEMSCRRTHRGLYVVQLCNVDVYSITGFYYQAKACLMVIYIDCTACPNWVICVCTLASNFMAPPD